MQNISRKFNIPNIKHLSLSGLLSPFNLFLIKKLTDSNKKVLYIVPDEQTALKYQKDLKTLLDIECAILPMSEIDLYCDLDKNYYTYQEQINIFLNSPDIVIASVKSLFEKFNNTEFYKNNSINLTKNSSVDYSKIAQRLVEFGYKRTTQVTDIGEFALRGDILDIYS